MKVYKSADIRNVALIGGAKAGKTTLAESMLLIGGSIKRKGSVDEKNTVSDYRDVELERQNSVYSTVLYTEYEGKKINFIDTPGMDDFVGEVISSLKVIESGIVVVNAQNGVEVGTEIAWRNTNKYNTPIIFAINHLEHEKSNFDETIRQLRSQFGSGITPCQFPVNVGIGFNAIVDLLTMKHYTYNEDGDGEPTVTDIPEELMDKAQELQAEMIEELAGSDEELMELFFENGTLTEEEISGAMTKGLTERTFFPVFCINAKHNMGVRRLMSFINNKVPAPGMGAETKTVEGKVIACDSSAAPSVFVFKTGLEQHLGEVSFFKVYAGELHESIDLINVESSTKERVSQLFAISGKNREKLERISAGDIGATIKLKNSKTNTSLTTTKNTEDAIEHIQFPSPKITMAVKAENSADDEKLTAAFIAMKRTDNTLHFEYSKELKQQIVRGNGELHLNIVKWQIQNTEKVEFNYFVPKIAYRETITKKARGVYRHKKQSGGAGQFGEVHLLIEPYHEGMKYESDYSIRGTNEHTLDWGGKLILQNCIVGGAIDTRFLPAILKGIMEKMEDGPLTGSYARDVVVYIYDGKMHPVDSNEMAFKLAGRNAFKTAFQDAGPKILEPIYNVEVLIPEDKFGDIMTDLQGRRAIIMGSDAEGNYQKIIAQVPLSEMNRYSTALSSITSGRAMYSLEYANYAPVPGDIQTKLLAEYAAEEED